MARSICVTKEVERKWGCDEQARRTTRDVGTRHRAELFFVFLFYLFLSFCGPVFMKYVFGGDLSVVVGFVDIPRLKRGSEARLHRLARKQRPPVWVPKRSIMVCDFTVHFVESTKLAVAVYATL